MWPESFPIPREQMLKKIQGKDAIFCLLTEKIDNEVLDAAGKAHKMYCWICIEIDIQMNDR